MDWYGQFGRKQGNYIETKRGGRKRKKGRLSNEGWKGREEPGGNEEGN